MITILSYLICPLSRISITHLDSSKRKIIYATPLYYPSHASKNIITSRGPTIGLGKKIVKIHLEYRYFSNPQLKRMSLKELRKRKLDVHVKRLTVSKCIVSAFPLVKCVLLNVPAMAATTTTSIRLFQSVQNSN